MTGNLNHSNNIVDLSPSSKKILIHDPNTDWWKSIRNKIKELNQLETGWDGYHGTPVKFNAGYFALTILEKCAGSIMFEPDVVPCSDGSIQLEWHYGDESIELRVSDMYEARAWRISNDTCDDGEETSISIDITIINSWLSDFPSQESMDIIDEEATG